MSLYNITLSCLLNFISTHHAQHPTHGWSLEPTDLLCQPNFACEELVFSGLWWCTTLLCTVCPHQGTGSTIRSRGNRTHTCCLYISHGWSKSLHHRNLHPLKNDKSRDVSPGWIALVWINMFNWSCIARHYYSILFPVRKSCLYNCHISWMYKFLGSPDCT